MPHDVLTPVWSGQGWLAEAVELPFRHARGAPPAPERRGRLSLSVRPRTGPDGERAQRGALHDRLARRRPWAEPRGCLYPLQPCRRPAHQPDRRPAELGRVLLPAAERI